MDPRLADLADFILGDNHEAAAKTFDAIMLDRVSNRIEARKMDVAGRLFNQPEVKPEES